MTNKLFFLVIITLVASNASFAANVPKDAGPNTSSEAAKCGVSLDAQATAAETLKCKDARGNSVKANISDTKAEFHFSLKSSPQQAKFQRTVESVNYKHGQEIFLTSPKVLLLSPKVLPLDREIKGQIQFLITLEKDASKTIGLDVRGVKPGTDWKIPGYSFELTCE